MQVIESAQHNGSLDRFCQMDRNVVFLLFYLRLQALKINMTTVKRVHEQLCQYFED